MRKRHNGGLKSPYDPLMIANPSTPKLQTQEEMMLEEISFQAKQVPLTNRNNSDSQQWTQRIMEENSAAARQAKLMIHFGEYRAQKGYRGMPLYQPIIIQVPELPFQPDIP